MKIYQIYYDEKSKKTLEKEYIPYFNEVKSPFFENVVIQKLLEEGKHLEDNYFGVVGNKLRQKLKTTRHWGGPFKNHSKKPFTPKDFEIQARKYDVMSFTRNPPHNMISLAGKYHPGFEKAWNVLAKHLGGYKPGIQKYPIYFNYFVAKGHIWEEYKPYYLEAIDLMNNNSLVKTWMFRNSQYGEHVKKGTKWCMEHYGRPYPTFHTFILERLFSVWLQDKNYKVGYY